MLDLKNKILTLAVLAALAISPFLNSTWAGATVKEPQLTLSGSVTKDIIDLNNVFLYQDQNGKNISLDYQYDKNRNITFSVYNIKFANAFLNKTVAKATSSVSTALATNINLLKDTAGIDYILITTSNNTALATNTAYSAQYELNVNIDFNRNYYLLIIAKNVTSTGTSSTLSYFDAVTRIYMLDEGGEDHILALRMRFPSSTETINIIDSDGDGKTDDLLIITKADDTNYVVFQKAIAILEEQLSVTLVRIYKISYGLEFKTGSSLESIYNFKLAYRVLNIFNTKVTLNGLTVNTSYISINSAKIISSIKINKIADATIPFIHIIPAEKYYDANELSAKYDYIFSLPNDPALSFSNVVANFTVGDFKSPNANISYFLVSGSDYTTQLEQNGYYSWSITPGTQYYVSAKFVLAEDLFDKVVGTFEGPPAFWVNPIGWLAYKFWSTIAFFAALLGFTGTVIYARKKQREIKANEKTTKRK